MRKNSTRYVCDDVAHTYTSKGRLTHISFFCFVDVSCSHFLPPVLSCQTIRRSSNKVCKEFIHYVLRRDCLRDSLFRWISSEIICGATCLRKRYSKTASILQTCIAWDLTGWRFTGKHEEIMLRKLSEVY